MIVSPYVYNFFYHIANYVAVQQLQFDIFRQIKAAPSPKKGRNLLQLQPFSLIFNQSESPLSVQGIHLHHNISSEESEPDQYIPLFHPYSYTLLLQPDNLYPILSQNPPPKKSLRSATLRDFALH